MMNDLIKNKEQQESKFKKIVKNPLAPYFLFGLILIAFQVVNIISDMVGQKLIPVSFISGLGLVMIYSIVAIGFCLLLGYSGLASLGTAGFIGIGVYVAYYGISNGLPFILIVLGAIILAVIIGMIVGTISLRIEGIYLAIITLGLSEILRTAFVAIKDSLNVKISEIQLFFMQVDKEIVYILIAVILTFLMIITINIMRSPTGRAMLTMKNSSSAAQAYGISIFKYRLLAFILSVCYAALGGIMYMMYVRSVSTSMTQLFTLSTSLNILGAVIIGGHKSLFGTITGIFIMYGIQPMFLQNIEFFRENPTLIMLFTGILIIVVVMFLPGGLAQLVYKLKAKASIKLTEWRARKYG